MQVNQIIPMDIRERICVHCDDECRTTYLITEPRQGKTTETVRQAVFRRCHVLSREYDFFRSVGLKHVSEVENNEIGFMGIRDLVKPENRDLFKGKEKIRLCVDGAKGIMEELLSLFFETPVEIQYMSLEAPRKE